MKNLLTSISQPCLDCGGQANYQEGGEFQPHMMYNPETGEPVEVASMEEHMALAEQGFLSEEQVQQMQQGQQQQMEAGGAHMQNGLQAMKSNINKHFKNAASARDNMFLKDPKAPQNQSTDEYTGARKGLFTDFVKASTQDALMKQAMDEVTANKEQEMIQMQQQMMNRQGLPMAKYGYNIGQNFGMGNEKDITPWVNEYSNQLQDNKNVFGAVKGAIGSGFQNMFAPKETKLKTKTKFLFGDDKYIEGRDILDRHGNVKRTTKGKVKRDYFGEGRWKDKRAFKNMGYSKRDQANSLVTDVTNGYPQNQVNNNPQNLNTDMKRYNDMLVNPWRQQGGSIMDERFGGMVDPNEFYYHQGGNIPSHNHSGSARDMTDMVDLNGQQVWLQGYNSSDPNDVSAFTSGNQNWYSGRGNSQQRYLPQDAGGYTHKNFSPRWGGGDRIAGDEGDGNPKIPGVTGYWSVKPGVLGPDHPGSFNYNVMGNPEGFDDYWKNKADYIPTQQSGPNVTFSDPNDWRGGMTQAEIDAIEISEQEAADDAAYYAANPGVPNPNASTGSTKNGAAASVEEVQKNSESSVGNTEVDKTTTTKKKRGNYVPPEEEDTELLDNGSGNGNRSIQGQTGFGNGNQYGYQVNAGPNVNLRSASIDDKFRMRMFGSGLKRHKANYQFTHDGQAPWRKNQADPNAIDPNAVDRLPTRPLEQIETGVDTKDRRPIGMDGKEIAKPDSQKSIRELAIGNLGQGNFSEDDILKQMDVVKSIRSRSGVDRSAQPENYAPEPSADMAGEFPLRGRPKRVVKRAQKKFDKGVEKGRIIEDEDTFNNGGQPFNPYAAEDAYMQQQQAMINQYNQQRYGGQQYEKGGELNNEATDVCPEGYVNNGNGCVPFQGNNSHPPQLDFNPNNTSLVIPKSNAQNDLRHEEMRRRLRYFDDNQRANENYNSERNANPYLAPLQMAVGGQPSWAVTDVQAKTNRGWGKWAADAGIDPALGLFTKMGENYQDNKTGTMGKPIEQAMAEGDITNAPNVANAYQAEDVSQGGWAENSMDFKPNQKVFNQFRGYDAGTIGGAAVAQYGGQYQMGGTYEVSEDEVNAILAAGGQIEYL